MNVLFREIPKQVRLGRALTFLVVPGCLVVFGQLFPKPVFWSWLTILTSYVVLISVLGVTNLPDANSERIIRPAVRMLGSVVWGGFLLMLYLLVYSLLFHYRDLAAR